MRQFFRIINKSEALDNIYSLFKQNIKSCNAEGDFARLLNYRYSIIFEMLGFRHSTVVILVFDGVKVKTTNTGIRTSAEAVIRVLSGFTSHRFFLFEHFSNDVFRDFSIAFDIYKSLSI